MKNNTNAGEYRATHEEKTGVVRELRNMEDKYKQDLNTEKSELHDKMTKALMQKPEVKRAVEAYEDAKELVKITKKKMEKLGIEANRYDNDRIGASDDSCARAAAALNKRYDDRCAALSLIRSQIQLATFRSEVSNLNDAARKL